MRCFVRFLSIASWLAGLGHTVSKSLSFDFEVVVTAGGQVRLVQTNYSNSWNKDLIVMTEHLGNSSYYGPVTLDILTDLPTFSAVIKVFTKERTFIEHFVDFCKIGKSSRGFFKSVFQELLSLHDVRLMQCPIKKGQYTLLPGRKSDFINDYKFSIPGYIPSLGKYYTTLKARTILKKKPVSLFNTSEIYEFVND